MPHAPHSTTVLVLAAGITVLLGPAAQARTVTPAPGSQPGSAMQPPDVQGITAAALPLPQVPATDAPSVLLLVARQALQAGRAGEAQEALERAETRLLDRAPGPPAAAVPDEQQAILAIAAARRALAMHDRASAIRAVDDALAAAAFPLEATPGPAPTLVPGSPAQPPVGAASAPFPEPVRPVVTLGLLPGHWALHGANWGWIPPDTRLRPVQAAPPVEGRFVWRDGAYAWVPAHYGN